MAVRRAPYVPSLLKEAHSSSELTPEIRSALENYLSRVNSFIDSTTQGICPYTERWSIRIGGSDLFILGSFKVHRTTYRVFDITSESYRSIEGTLTKLKAVVTEAKSFQSINQELR